MSATGNGTSQYLASAGTITAPASAYSYAFWINADHSPIITSPISNPFSLAAAGGSTQDIGFTWDHNDGAFYRSAGHLNADLATGSHVQFLSSPAAGVWVHIAVTWDGTNLRLYYNGYLHNTAAGSNPSSTAPNVSVLAYASGASGFMQAAIAEVAVWNVTLTAAEVLEVFCGQDASQVQNAAVKFYDPLNSGVATPIGPALTNHSTVINTSYFGPAQGGFGMGGDNMSVMAAYGWTPDGGFALGGANMAAAVGYHWTPDGGFAIGGANVNAQVAYGWTPDGGFALGGANMASTVGYHWTPTGGFALGGEPTVRLITSGRAHVLASNRSQANTTK